MTVTLEQYPILLWDGMIGEEAYPRSELAGQERRLHESQHLGLICYRHLQVCRKTYNPCDWKSPVPR